MLVTASSWETEQNSPYEREKSRFPGFVLSLEDGDWGVKWTERMLREVSKAIDIQALNSHLIPR